MSIHAKTGLKQSNYGVDIIFQFANLINIFISANFFSNFYQILSHFSCFSIK